MKLFASKRTQTLTNVTLAVLLVASALTASVPFIFSQKAGAAPDVSYTALPLSQADWSVDRSVPSGGWTVDSGSGQVTLNVDQTHANTSATFYQTEGVSRALPAGTDSVKADVFMPSDWNSKPNLRVGLWGVTQDAGLTGPSYPIIEYAANVGGYTGWRVWNANDGTWNQLSGVTTHFDGQNTVEIVSNFNTGNYDFYVNDAKVYSYSAEGYTNFTNMIFNNYNAATNDHSGDYSVVWSSISTGDMTPEAPLNPQWLLHDGTVLGAYTNVNLVTPSWTAPTGSVDHYEYSYKSPLSSSWSGPESFSATSIPDQSFFGAGNNGTEGTWQFRVRSVGSDGDTSAWVESAPLTYDKTAPTGLANLSPSDGTYGTTASLTQITWTAATDANGPVSYYYESSLSSALNSDGSFASPVYQSGALSDTGIPTPNTPAGVYYWHVRAVDAAGNSSAWTGAWKVTVDNTVPTASLTFPPRGPSATGFIVTYSEAMNVADATDPANYFLSNWPGAGGSGPLTGHATVAYDVPSHVATVTFTTPGWYVSGEQLWGVSNVRDLAGNPIATTTAYSTPLTSPTAPGTPTTTTPTTSVTSDWTWDAATDLPTPAADASGVKGYQYKFTQGSTIITDWTDVATTSVTTTAPADGTYQLHVRALDNAGSPAGPESVGSVVIDTTGPDVTVDTGTYSTLQPTITGTVGADATGLNVAIVDASNTVVEFGTATYTPGNTTWSYAVQHPLTDGATYTVTARAYDALNNFKDSSALVAVSVPTQQAPAPTTTVTTPTTPIITPVSAAAVLGATTTNDAVNNTADTGVQGATDAKTVANAVNSDANKGIVFGLAWYWWLLILAALASIVWAIVSAARRRGDDQL